MPSILHKNDKIDFIARKGFTYNGKRFESGDDCPEINDHPRLETFVRNGYVIPVVEDKSDLPFQFRRTAMTREMAYKKLAIGNPAGGRTKAPEEPVAEPEDLPEEEYDPAKHTVDEVEKYVADHPDEASKVYVLEEQGKNRSTLLSKLDDMRNDNKEEEQDNG